MKTDTIGTYEQVIATIPYNENRQVRISLVGDEHGGRRARIQVWSTNTGRNDRFPDAGCIVLAEEQLPAVIEALKTIRYRTEPQRRS